MRERLTPARPGRRRRRGWINGSPIALHQALSRRRADPAAESHRPCAARLSIRPVRMLVPTRPASIRACATPEMMRPVPRSSSRALVEAT